MRKNIFFIYVNLVFLCFGIINNFFYSVLMEMISIAYHLLTRLRINCLFASNFLTIEVSEVTLSCPTLCDPMDCSLPGSSVHGFSSQEYWSQLPFLLQGIPKPGIEPRSPTLQTDALPSEPPIARINYPTDIASLPLGLFSSSILVIQLSSFHRKIVE